MLSIRFAAAALLATAVTPVFAQIKAAAASSSSTSTTSAATTATTGVEEPSALPTLGSQVVQGCFSSQGLLTFNGSLLYNSKSSCAIETCMKNNYTVAGTMAGNRCYCGFKYPPKDTLVDDSNCNVGCSGYGLQACGGIQFWTIYNTGLDLAVEYASDAEVSSAHASSSTSTSATAVTSALVTGGRTIIVTASNAAAAQTSSSSAAQSGSGTNTTGIAVGVVVAVVGVAGILGGIFLLMRHRRNQEIEEEHRRNAAVNSFIGKPPGSSGGMSMTDSRLDPVMAQRRMSSGSIADNQDYSRRILRVTNA